MQLVPFFSFQLERVGFFTVDPDTDAVGNKLVINRSVGASARRAGASSCTACSDASDGADAGGKRSDDDDDNGSDD